MPKQQHSELEWHQSLELESKSGASALQQRGGWKVSVLPLGTTKQTHFALDFSLAQVIPLSWAMDGGEAPPRQPRCPRLGAGTQAHCRLISQSSVYVSVILLMTAPCQLKEEKGSPALQKDRAAWADTTWSLTKPASTKITSQKHSNTSEQAEWANIRSALCITGLQHLWPSLQSPKFGFAAFFRPVSELTYFQFCQLIAALCAKFSNHPPGWKNTSIYTSGRGLICGTYNGWGSASEIIWWNWAGKLHYPCHTQAVFFHTCGNTCEQRSKEANWKQMEVTAADL